VSIGPETTMMDMTGMSWMMMGGVTIASLLLLILLILGIAALAKYIFARRP
jgi:hypothetical protein